MLISERIYRYLAERNMSQIEFAEKTGISPYELLSGTENSNHKKYMQIDHIVIDKNSKEYNLIEVYQNLNSDAQKRLEGYLDALREIK